MRGWERKRTEINAVHSDESAELLQQLGVLEPLENGDLRCGVCGAPLRDDGLGAVRGHGEGVILVCSRPDCIREIA